MPITRRDLLRTGSCAFLVAAYAGRPRQAHALTAPTTFNYYISTTGSNSNPGTLASPWAITALNSPSLRALYAGKSIGLIAGVYNVHALHQAAPFNSPALCVQGGSSGSPTYIASCDSTGVYKPRVAMLSADSSGSLNGGSYPTAGGGVIGQSATGNQQTVWGNVILDGLYITRAYQFGITFWGRDATVAGSTSGNVVQNCEIYDIAGWENNNMAGLQFWSQSGALAHNNLIHSVIPNSGNLALWDCSGIAGQMNLNNIYEYNTIYNCNSGIFDKNANCGGHTYRYNYIESLGKYPNAAVQDAAGGNPGQTITAHHNVMVSAVGQNEGVWCGSDAISGHMPSLSSFLIYNNTFYLLGSNSQEIYITSAGTGTSPPAMTKFYNNAVVCASAIGFAGLLLLGPQSGVAYSDYNCFYQPNAGSSTPLFGMGSGNWAPTGALHSLASWQSTFGLDAHSLVANPSFANAGVALTPTGYQLKSGSPCLNAGRVGGTSAGAACHIGAWDGTATQIGCNFTAGSSGTTPIPVAPALTVS